MEGESKAIILGSYVEFDKRIELALKIANTEDGATRDEFTTAIKKNRELNDFIRGKNVEWSTPDDSAPIVPIESRIGPSSDNNIASTSSVESGLLLSSTTVSERVMEAAIAQRIRDKWERDQAAVDGGKKDFGRSLNVAGETKGEAKRRVYQVDNPLGFLRHISPEEVVNKMFDDLLEPLN